MGMYQPEIETMDRNELEKLQLERLQKQVKNVYENVPMYRERMDKKGVKPEDIKELKDLARSWLPRNSSKILQSCLLQQSRT